MAEYQNIKGAAELARTLRLFAPRLAQKHLRQAVSRGAAIVRDEARKTGAFSDRTGLLRSRIQMKLDKEHSHAMAAAYAVYVAVGRSAQQKGRTEHFDPTTGKTSRGRLVLTASPYYWRHVEFGTAKMAARPFMRPAFESHKLRALNVIVESLAQGVQKTADELRGQGRL